MTRDLKAAYRSDEDVSLDERAEAQREIVAEYRAQNGSTFTFAGNPDEPRWHVYGSAGGQADKAGGPKPS
jgi:hypothetical protein